MELFSWIKLLKLVKIVESIDSWSKWTPPAQLVFFRGISDTRNFTEHFCEGGNVEEKITDY